MELNELQKKQNEFLHRFDFMRLGQAVNSGNTKAVIMISKKMEAFAKEAELPNFARLITGVRLSMASGAKAEALNIMTQLTAQRVKMINHFSDNFE